MRAQTQALFAAAALSALVYLHLLRLDAVNGWRPVSEFLACMFVLFLLYFAASRVVTRKSAAQSGAWKWVAAGAVLFRLILLPAGLPAGASSSAKLNLLKQDISSSAVTYERFQLFDDDIWRYLWDGHILAAGVNPYRFAPADAALDSVDENTNPIWNDIRENVSYPAVPTIYPPLAQAFFWLSNRLAPGSVLAMKALLNLFDLAAAGLLALTLRAMGVNPEWALLYAWNPLVIKVFAGSGHVDAIAVAFMMAMAYCLARAAPAAAAIALGLAILVKISPVILLPFFWRRAGFRNAAIALAVVVIGYLPFLSAGMRIFGGLAGFAREWQFNASLYTVARWMAQPFTAHASAVAKAACGALLIALLARIWRRKSSATLAGEAADGLGWLVLLSPAIMPWYATWALPFAVLARRRVWIAWTGIVCLAFFVMVDGTERPLILALEYISLLGVWLFDVHLKQRNKTT